MINVKKAVFLDRDGTINHDPGYISKTEQFELYPYAAEAIKLFNNSGFYTFVVTNQSGVARGHFSLEEVDAIHKKMTKKLAEKGAYIDEIFIAPYHKDGVVKPYNIDHPDRKPELGLFRKAKKLYEFAVNKSFMIGDRYSDIVFGRRAGLKTILVTTGEGESEFMDNRDSWDYQPDFIVKDLLIAAKFIVSGIT